MSGDVLGPYAGLCWRFTIRCEGDLFTSQVARVFESLRTAPVGGESEYVLTKPGSTAGQLSLDGSTLTTSWDDRDLFSDLLWHVNAATVEASRDYVLLHAAAAELHGQAIVLSAPMEAGKTTLVAGLLRTGMRYLTDETVAIRPSDGQIVPFPKALSVDTGSWAVLAEFKPIVPSAAERLLERQWQVAPHALGADIVSSGAVPAVFVLPRYMPGAATDLRHITPGEALIEALQQTFRFERQRARDMEVLAKALGRCACYRLISSNVDEAAITVRGTLLRASND